MNTKKKYWTPSVKLMQACITSNKFEKAAEKIEHMVGCKSSIWLDANRLSLNIDKTNFVIFHHPRIKIPEPVIVKFGRKKIQRENCVKFLGVLLDANLSWKYHINELLKKLSRTLGLFYKIRYYLPLEILKQLYYSLFYSFVSYGITVWGLTY